MMAALGAAATPRLPLAAIAPSAAVAGTPDGGAEADAAAGSSRLALALSPREVLDRPASMLISEAILRGLERFPVGPPRSAECARRRKDVRAALPQLAKILERIDEAQRIGSGGTAGGSDGTAGAMADSEHTFQRRRTQWVLDRYCGLRFALRTLEAHDRLCRGSCGNQGERAVAWKGSEDDVVVEYSFLRDEIESRQAHAEDLLCRLEGSSFSLSGALVWSLLWLASPLVHLGGALAGCAYRPVALLRDGCSDRDRNHSIGVGAT